MAAFETAITTELEILRPGDFGAEADEALWALQERGIVAARGLTEHVAGALAVAAYDPDTLEFCRDEPKRFGTRHRAEAWQSKGRAMFTLGQVQEGPLSDADLSAVDDGDLQLLAYGWAGEKQNAHIPGANITTAYRVLEHSRGQGLSRLLTNVVVGATASLYDVDPETISLDTWQSNAVAVHTYKKAGFIEVAHKVEDRPTLAKIGEVVGGHTVFASKPAGQPMGTYVQDTRLFMRYDPGHRDAGRDQSQFIAIF